MEQPSEAPVAEVDTRNAGQVIVDIMASQGYTCTMYELNWECSAPGSTWPVSVSFVEQEGATTIWFDSWLERAFAQPCSKFAFAVRDLADAQGSFEASCDDGRKMFRLNTAVTYGADLDVMGWLHDHEARRLQAGMNLRSIRALSRDSARGIAQR